MKIKITSLNKNLIALGFGLAICLIILEILLRIHNPFSATVKINKITLSANNRVVYINRDSSKLSPEIVISTNSLGFRGEEPPRMLKDYLSIITIGGSTTHCYYNSDDKTWPYQLKARLGKEFDKIWLNNAGLCGHSTFGHIILMEDYIVRIKPKIVLFLVGINDIGREDGDVFGLFNKDNKSVVTYFKKVLYKSELMNLIINLSRKIKAHKMNLRHDLHFDLARSDYLELSQTMMEGKLEEHKKKYIPLFRERLLKLVRVCKDNDIDPVFVTQPVLYGEVVDSITGVNLEKIKISDTDNGLMGYRVLQLYNQATIDIAKENNCFFIDLASQMLHNSLYYYDLAHYTDKGNEMVADIIFEHLAPYLSLKYQSFLRKG